MNLTVVLVLLFAFIGILISIKRIDYLTKDYQILLNFLEKEE